MTRLELKSYISPGLLKPIIGIANYIYFFILKCETVHNITSFKIVSIVLLVSGADIAAV